MLPRINFFADEEHYLKHLIPVWKQLLPERRGFFIVKDTLEKIVRMEGIGRYLLYRQRPMDEQNIRNLLTQFTHPSETLAMVVSARDHANALAMGFAVVRGEHGIGQTYVAGKKSDSSVYAGSPNHKFLFAYFAPGVWPHQKQTEAHPEVAAFRTGCPYLDRFAPYPDPEPAATGFVFHWDNTVQPESAATWPYWSNAICELVADGKEVWLHCHPRERGRFAAEFLQPSGLMDRWVPTLEELHLKCGVICGDNTSAMYMLAAAGHPLVVLNHTKYRHHINHGLRFWDAADAGVNCDRAGDLPAAIEQAGRRREVDWKYRESALNYVFYRREGASIIEALLLEHLADFAKSHQEGDRKREWVLAHRTFDCQVNGPIKKGRNYNVPSKNAKEWKDRKFVEASTAPEMPRDMEMAEQSSSSEGKSGIQRKPNDALYQVKEGFKENGVSYKPGDLVRTSEVSNENQRKCQNYTPQQRNKRFPEGMEMK